MEWFRRDLGKKAVDERGGGVVCLDSYFCSGEDIACTNHLQQYLQESQNQALDNDTSTIIEQLVEVLYPKNAPYTKIINFSI